MQVTLTGILYRVEEHHYQYKKGSGSCCWNLIQTKPVVPDDVSPRVLKEVPAEVAPTHCIIYRVSISSDTGPSDWRDANVTPMFKMGEYYDSSKLNASISDKCTL